MRRLSWEVVRPIPFTLTELMFLANLRYLSVIDLDTRRCVVAKLDTGLMESVGAVNAWRIAEAEAMALLVELDGL